MRDSGAGGQAQMKLGRAHRARIILKCTLSVRRKMRYRLMREKERGVKPGSDNVRRLSSEPLILSGTILFYIDLL